MASAAARRPKMAAMQRPETLSTYLKLGPVHSIGVHALHNLECPCRLHCGRGWPASVPFRPGRPVSSAWSRRICKMIPPHDIDR